MINKLDWYTWTKRMIARSTAPKTIKSLFIKRYGTRNVPLLKSVMNQLQVEPGNDGIWWQLNKKTKKVKGIL